MPADAVATRALDAGAFAADAVATRALDAGALAADAVATRALDAGALAADAVATRAPEAAGAVLEGGVGGLMDLGDSMGWQWRSSGGEYLLVILGGSVDGRL